MTDVLVSFAVAVAALVVLYGLFLAWVHAIHDKAAFPGAGEEVDFAAPGGGSLEFEDLFLPVIDGTSVHAWWIPAKHGDGSIQDPPTLLYFHGNGYPLEAEAEHEAPALHQTGMNLLLVDYRGFGLSSRMQTTSATTAADAQAALRYLTETKGVARSRIWIGGRSIGSAVAVRLAAEAPGCAGLILLTPITNTVDVKPFGPVLRPLSWLGLARNFDSLRRIGSLRVPVLLLGVREDKVAPPAMVRRLHERAPGPKRIEIFEGGHNDLWSAARTEVVAAITETVRPPVHPA